MLYLVDMNFLTSFAPFSVLNMIDFKEMQVKGLPQSKHGGSCAAEGDSTVMAHGFHVDRKS